MLIQKDLFSSQYPKEEGTYLWIGDYSEELELILVKYYEPKAEYGMQWDGYFGVVGMRGRNVTQLSGKFLKIDIK